jgi:hypothetical protein
MDGLVKFAARLDGAAATLTRASATLAGLDPGSVAFAGAPPGRLGEVGRALQAQLTKAIATRSHEAASASARLADTAQVLRSAAARYRDADDAAHRRLSRREP